ncbi:MAG: class I SAM-dependent rRNA methyltransferase [Candidatus Limivicinus sp.]|nr:class I SAM-dependent rRNA methyltransferase [Clostridiales bacterium]MCI7136901.1 class I SAM-dependent rRNA methyltransferase [Clostridiales bacterium]MDY6133483.1 class I SAM-dependent rRNA methyltransferase [Candidatus Limivicinus sp.]
MKAERGFPRFIITPKGTRWVEQGHPWIYADEVIREEGACENGALADAVSEKGKYLGTGFVSRESKIRLRLLSRNANDRFDQAFWKRRIKYAWDYRKTVMGEDISCCRVIFGEADSFPGLTVDRFSDILVTQTLSVGMEKIKPMLFPLLVQVLREDGQEIRGIYERNDVAIRALEGMEQNKGWFPLAGETPPDSTITEICENGIVYSVDVENGQKTGFFLDQKYNRLAVARLAKGRRVLDCFTHTGSFALNAAKGGAEHVTAVDVSASAIEMARANARRNGLEEKMDFITADVFDLLPELAAKGKAPYDFIILDPPAFTKSRKTVNSAERGYKEINLRALKLLPRGGYFATASCSHFMPSELFVKMLRSAALDAGVELRQIEARQQAPDHPILWNVPETDYLKFYIFQVV